jgi:uncharacterized cupin superfamily protein
MRKVSLAAMSVAHCCKYLHAIPLVWVLQRPSAMYGGFWTDRKLGGDVMSKSVVIAAAASADLRLDSMPRSMILDGAPRSGNRILAQSADGTAIVWVWECSVGRFIWHYSCDETVYVISGEAFVTSESGGEERRFGAGDMVFFPGGCSYIWRITEPVKKVAVTRKDLPCALGFAVRVGHKIAQIVGLRRRHARKRAMFGLRPRRVLETRSDFLEKGGTSPATSQEA